MIPKDAGSIVFPRRTPEIFSHLPDQYLIYWFFLNSWAAHKNGTHLDRGEILISKKGFARKVRDQGFDASEKQVRNFFDEMEKIGEISKEKFGRTTKYKVRFYDQYQSFGKRETVAAVGRASLGQGLGKVRARFRAGLRAGLNDENKTDNTDQGQDQGQGAKAFPDFKKSKSGQSTPLKPLKIKDEKLLSRTQNTEYINPPLSPLKMEEEDWKRKLKFMGVQDEEIDPEIEAEVEREHQEFLKQRERFKKE